MLSSVGKTFSVIVGATILATLTVSAVDTGGQDVARSLGAMLGGETEIQGPCPRNMVLVDQTIKPFCVDMYEASASEDCLFNDPQSLDESELNLIDPTCTPVTLPRVTPWRYLDQQQASVACERAGKRLPTPGEWYRAALGTPDAADYLSEEHCNIDSNRGGSLFGTGLGMRCVSDVGAYDMVGNVWEWVLGVSDYGTIDGVEVPASGYVHNVDVDGVPVETGSRADERFSGDRFWSDPHIAAGLMRGGYYNSKEGAGLYTIYAASPPTFVGEAVGFRCVADPQSEV
jgi:hypothetical protein